MVITRLVAVFHTRKSAGHIRGGAYDESETSTEIGTNRYSFTGRRSGGTKSRGQKIHFRRPTEVHVFEFVGLRGRKYGIIRRRIWYVDRDGPVIHRRVQFAQNAPVGNGRRNTIGIREILRLSVPCVKTKITLVGVCSEPEYVFFTYVKNENDRIQPSICTASEVFFPGG